MDDVYNNKAFPLQKMPVETIEAIAETELKKHGLWQKGWRLAFIDKASRTIGDCWKVRKLIRLNMHYIKYGLVPEQIVDTIRHEIAHALDDGGRRSRSGKRMVHDAHWKMLARHVGANPAAANETTGYVKPDHLKSKAKWAMVLLPDNLEPVFIRACPRFLVSMASRYLPDFGKAASLGKLWLTPMDQWTAYDNDQLPITEMNFYQENPNDDWFPGFAMNISENGEKIWKGK